MLVLIYLCITISYLFICLPTLELTIFEQQVCSTKIGYANPLSLGTNSCKKKERSHFEHRSAHQAKKQRKLCGCLERQLDGLHSFFWKKLEKKVERKCIQEQQRNQFHYYNQNMSCVNRMDQNVGKYRIGIRMKKW